MGGVRKPAVAGSFYPSDSQSIMQEVGAYLEGAREQRQGVLGLVAPHAGWYYSGHVAGAVVGAAPIPDRIILIGPNHHGLGAMAALDDSSGWEFPFGTVPVDEGLSSAMADGCPSLEYDASAHSGEHSLEVIVPFLYAKNPDISIAAISLYTYDEAFLMELARCVAEAAGRYGALIVASSDMTHYLPDGVVRENDGETIEVIRKLDPKAVLKKSVKDQSLCGAPAVVVAEEACLENGATRAELEKYATSGDIAGDRSSVVGYAGITFCE